MSSKGRHRRSKKKRADGLLAAAGQGAGAPGAPAAVAAGAAPPPASPPREPAAEARADDDDLSVPPMSDLDARFFDARPFDASGLDDAALFELDPLDPSARKSGPVAAQRRAYLARYVKGVVAFAVVLCAAAVVKTAVVRGDATVGVPTLTAAPRAAAKAMDTTDEATAEPGPAPALTPEVRAEVTVPAPRPAGAVPAKPASKAVAADEAAAARSALEHGHVAAAVHEGERATADDPSDATAWLILGAAYDQRGDARAARRAFERCVERASRGPKGECAALLR